MPPRYEAGPSDRRLDRGPREDERFGRQLGKTNTADEVARQARRAVDDLVANGAELHYRAASGDLMPSFIYELRAGGDRQRCRSIISKLRPEPLLWAAVVKEIALREVDDDLKQ